MEMSESGVVDAGRSRTKLAGCVAAVLGLASPAAFATVSVSNCNDSGIGSLRSAVTGAPSGETVDASGLLGVCSKITLTTGAIVINKTNLTIKGPGPGELVVTAKYGAPPTSHQYENRIFTHTGSGLLYLQDITTSKGYQVQSPSHGGCIYSAGAVKLKNVRVTGCTAKNANSVNGGGVYAKGMLTMTRSSITQNDAKGGSGTGMGGGTASAGLRAYYSTVSLNSSSNNTDTFGFDGGISSRGDTYIVNSTISSNTATGDTGGMGVFNGNLKVVNSTISSNSAAMGAIGGVYAASPSVQIFNSTITANTAFEATPFAAAGATFKGQGASPTVVIQSSIIANNSYEYPTSIDNDLASTVVIGGNNNLVRASNASLPVDTIIGKCPFLGPLDDNGGLTRTHKLLGRSPAIDVGNNTFGASFDQRGKLTVNGERNYPRVSGPTGVAPRADIGAYEVNRSDEIFDAIFEEC